MALIPEFTIQLGYPNQKLIYFQDTTPDYDATDEPGGYGTPNIAKVDVDHTVISAKAPGADAFTELIDLDYMPVDGQIEITCDNYDPDEEEEEEDDCSSCGGESILSDCVGVTDSCFVDGCWTFKYDVYSDADTVAGTVTQSVLLYSQTKAALVAIGKKTFNGTTQCNDEKYLDLYYQAKSDFEDLLFVAQVDGCDCDCVASGLASVQKKIIKLQADPAW